MIRLFAVAGFAVALIVAAGSAQTITPATPETPTATTNPTYQRSVRRVPNRLPPRFVPPFQAPAAQGFSFQRPYPYHLDYYRQRYQGGYEPYFGNLYGSPGIVGTQPFAFGQFPNQSPNRAPVQAPPHAGPAPYAAPVIACPHCQQPISISPAPAAEN